jgi:tRNA(Ile)-lysidine synthase
MSKGGSPFLLKADFSGIPKEGFVIVGFSGGADSVVLADLLLQTVEKERVILAHVNHCLRGEESLRDEAFARDFAEKRQIACRCIRLDIENLARQEKMGLEEYGRNARYDFFASLVQTENDVIVTAHHADDNSETILLNFTKGASLSGLCGIPAKRGNILRPLLQVSRKEIEEYCREKDLSYVTDHTNFMACYERNKIRLQVVPVLRQINPDFTAAAQRAAGNVSVAYDFIRQEAKRVLGEVLQGEAVSRKELQQAHPALRRECIRLYLEQRGCARLEQKHILKGEQLLLSGGRCSLPGGITLECSGNRFLAGIEREEITFSQPAILGKQRLPSGKILILEKKTLSFQENREKIHNLLFKNMADYDTITDAFLVRTRQPGDRFFPQGRNCGKSLKQMFQERQILPLQRQNLVLLESQGKLVYCEKLGVSQPFAVTGSTKTALLISVEEEDRESAFKREDENSGTEYGYDQRY